CAQLVRHAREELRLMLTGRFELSALHLYLSKQPRVLDGQDGLRREGLQQLDNFLLEPAGLAPPDDKAADALALEEQRHGQERPIAVPLEEHADPLYVVASTAQHVGDLNGSPQCSRFPCRTLSEPNGRRTEDGSEIIIETVCRSDTAELLRGIVVVVDD